MFDIRKIRVLVDSGHGSNTPGKGSPYSLYGVKPALKFREWEWTREVADMLVAALRECDINAERLVPETYDVSLIERVKRVNEACKKYGKENVILISIHNNALGMGDAWHNNATGWSAWTSVGQTKSDVLADFLYEAAKENFPGHKLRADKSDNDNDCESQFYILQKTLCAAVLTENFFMTAESDVKYLLSDEGKEAVVKTHVEGIMKYIQKA